MEKEKLHPVAEDEPQCGNGILEIDEQCDDGNLQNEDNCNQKCEVEKITPETEFSDNKPENKPEQTQKEETLTPEKKPMEEKKPLFTIAECGNGALEVGERCDDGNTTNGDGCSYRCRIEPAPEKLVTEKTQSDDSKQQKPDLNSILAEKVAEHWVWLDQLHGSAFEPKLGGMGILEIFFLG